MKVVIPEYIPSLNKGEAAILEGIRQALVRAFGHVQITVFSPSELAAIDARNYAGCAEVVCGLDLHGTRAYVLPTIEARGRLADRVTRLRWMLAARTAAGGFLGGIVHDRLLDAMSRADLILGGHNGFLDSGQYWLARAAKALGKPLVLFGGGKGYQARLTRRSARRLRYAVEHAVLCTVREESSRQYVIDSGVRPEKVELFPDPAVLMPPADGRDVTRLFEQERLPDPHAVPLLGVIPVAGGPVAKLSFGFAGTDAQRREMRHRMWTQLLERVLSQTDAHLVFIPHCVGPRDTHDDRRASRAIYRTLRDKTRATLIETEYSASVLKGLMKRCQYVLGERAHALIGSFSAGTPCMAFTVSRDLRMHGILGKMFQRPCQNLDAPQVEDLQAAVIRAWESRCDEAKRMEPHVAKIMSAAERSCRRLAECVRPECPESGE